MLYTYHLCYPAVRQRAITLGLNVWDIFIQATKPNPRIKTRKPIDEEERRLREVLADDLHHLSELVQAFVESISRESFGEDEDVLRFHELCLSIRNLMKGVELEKFLDEYICKPIIFVFEVSGPALDSSPPIDLRGVNKILELLRLPIAMSTLLALSRNPKLHLEDRCSVIVLEPSLGSRPFNAPVAEMHFAERFRDEPGMYWKDVVRAFDRSVEDTKAYRKGLQWDAQEKALSSPGPVIAHPEVTLIQYLLENSEGKTRAYIACSEVPCYASVLYAGAVNKALEARFTIRTDHPD